MEWHEVACESSYEDQGIVEPVSLDRGPLIVRHVASSKPSISLSETDDPDFKQKFLLEINVFSYENETLD